jgi:hypothetical protein
MAVADVQAYCSPAFLAALEPCSSFRFKFLRERNQNLTGRETLYDMLFDAFVEAGPGDRSSLPLLRNCFPAPDRNSIAEMRTLTSSFA